MSWYVAKKEHGFIIGGKKLNHLLEIKPCPTVFCIILLISVLCNITALIFCGQNSLLRFDSSQRNCLSELRKPPCNSLRPYNTNIQEAAGWKEKGRTCSAHPQIVLQELRLDPSAASEICRSQKALHSFIGAICHRLVPSNDHTGCRRTDRP